MNKTRIVVVGFVWLLIFAIIICVWKFWIAPSKEIANQQKTEAKRNQTLIATSTNSRYDHHLNLRMDGFSGYSVLRSKEFLDEVAGQRIKIDLQDDQADYIDRLKALQSGESQIAVFTVDALVKASSELNKLPATIVMAIDETRGADGAVVYKSKFPNIDSIDRADTKIVLTQNSPSETLARVIIARFGLKNITPESFIYKNSPEEVYKHYRSSKPDDPYVWILWEPYITKTLENPNVMVAIDSSQFRGYIFDVLVVNRDYLVKNKDVIEDIIKAYFRANYLHRNNKEDLVKTDAAKMSSVLSDEQAKRLVDGIWWKNTQENYSHFGVTQTSRRLQHIEDIIDNIIGVLNETNGLPNGDPTNDKPNLLYYPDILKQLSQINFHPGENEFIRDETVEYKELTDKQWDALNPVGKLEVPSLVFRRGTASLSKRSEVILDELVETLDSFPHYYILVQGDASTIGDIEANKQLAFRRATAASDYLIQKGVNEKRIKALAVTPTGETEVNFIFGQLDY